MVCLFCFLHIAVTCSGCSLCAHVAVPTCKAAWLYLCTHKGSRYRSHPPTLTLAADYFSQLTHFFCVWVKELLVTLGVRCRRFLAPAAPWCWMLFCYLSATWFAAHSAARALCMPACVISAASSLCRTGTLRWLLSCQQKVCARWCFRSVL